jgi:splicing factor 3A subunit 2
VSSFEQTVEPNRDRDYQYLLFAAEPYETVAFKIPNKPIDKDPNKFLTNWDSEKNTFTLQLWFKNNENINSTNYQDGLDFDRH